MDSKLKKLEEKLQETYKKGREQNVFVGGYGGGHLHADSYEEVEKHEAQRRKLALEVKEARAADKKARQDLKRHAHTVNDAANWTAKILEGESARFASSTDETAAKLAQARREEVRRREAAVAQRRESKKRQRKQQASKLSFEDEDGDD